MTATRTAHPNGNIFYSTPAALDAKITEILRVVAEIQSHSKSVIETLLPRFFIAEPRLRGTPVSRCRRPDPGGVDPRYLCPRRTSSFVSGWISQASVSTPGSARLSKSTRALLQATATEVPKQHNAPARSYKERAQSCRRLGLTAKHFGQFGDEFARVFRMTGFLPKPRQLAEYFALPLGRDMPVALQRRQNVGVPHVLAPGFQLFGAELQSVGKLSQRIPYCVRFEVRQPDAREGRLEDRPDRCGVCPMLAREACDGKAAAFVRLDQ